MALLRSAQVYCLFMVGLVVVLIFVGFSFFGAFFLVSFSFRVWVAWERSCAEAPRGLGWWGVLMEPWHSKKCLISGRILRGPGFFSGPDRTRVTSAMTQGKKPPWEPATWCTRRPLSGCARALEAREVNRRQQRHAGLTPQSGSAGAYGLHPPCKKMRPDA